MKLIWFLFVIITPVFNFETDSDEINYRHLSDDFGIKLSNGCYEKKYMSGYKDDLSIIVFLTCSNLTSNNALRSCPLEYGMEMFTHYVHLKIVDSNFQTMNLISFCRVDYILNYERLIFENTKIDTLKEGAFSQFINLRHLNLRDTNIQTIESGCFNGLKKVENLHLTNNKIGNQLKPNIFRDLQSLKKIFLGNTSIHDLNPKLFENLTELSEIYLSNNFITKLDKNVFTFLTNLNVVSLFNNNIVNIAAETFPATIQKLDLSFNNLTTVNKDMFTGNLNDTTMRLLNLDNNFIKSIHFLSTESLLLRNNDLTDISNTEVKGENVDVSFNRIKILSNVTFSASTTTFNISNNYVNEFDHLEGQNLKELDFSHNKITGKFPGLKFSKLRKLEILKLNSNHISDFDVNSFKGLDVLKVLNISYNSLDILKPKVFEPLISLKVLLVNGNHLRTLESAALKGNMPLLSVIGISHNRWSCLELTAMLEYFTRTNITLDHQVPSFRVSRLKAVHCEINSQGHDTKSANFNVTEEIEKQSKTPPGSLLSIEKERDHTTVSSDTTESELVAEMNDSKREFMRLKITLIVLITIISVVGIIQIYTIYKKRSRQAIAVSFKPLTELEI